MLAFSLHYLINRLVGLPWLVFSHSPLVLIFESFSFFYTESCIPHFPWALCSFSVLHKNQKVFNILICWFHLFCFQWLFWISCFTISSRSSISSRNGWNLIYSARYPGFKSSIMIWSMQISLFASSMLGSIHKLVRSFTEYEWLFSL